jgi:hypothetical protein
MSLTSRVDISQIRGAKTSLMASIATWESHVRGLDALTSGQHLDPATISAMARGPDRLLQRYAAIAAKRVSDAFPQLLRELDISDDPEFRKFMEWESS